MSLVNELPCPPSARAGASARLRLGVVAVVNAILVILTVCQAQQISTQPSPVASWASQWSTTNCTGSTIPAECADINSEFTYVPVSGGDGYVWATPQASGAHVGCTPNGVGSEDSSRQCGVAVFQLFCSRAAYVAFGGEVQAHARRPNDDSFWTYFDGNSRQFFNAHTYFPLAPTWAQRPMSPTKLLNSGTHTFVVAEREDGTRIRRLSITRGYPDCQFGAPLPQANWTADQVYQRVLALETETNNRVSAMSSTIAALNSTIAMHDAEVANSISMQVAAVTSTMSSQMTTQSSAIASALSRASATSAAVSTAVASLSTRLGGVASFAISSGETTPAAPEVASANADIVVKAARGGTVRVVSDQCQSDVCAIAAQVSQLTDALRAN